MSEGATSFGRNLAAIRKQRGLTQEQLAVLLVSSRDRIGRIERGQRQYPPSAEEITGWATRLGVEEQDLIAQLHDRQGGEAPSSSPLKILSDLTRAANDCLAKATATVRVWQTWLPGDVHLFDALASAVAGGAEVRILMLDPSCRAATQRATQLGFDPGSPVTFLDNVLVGLRRAGMTDMADILRLTDQMPPAQLYATETTTFASWFLPGRASTVMPQVQMPTSSLVARALCESFDATWTPLKAPGLGRP
jgi:transcriptional regulator with XRE-family HTH domain